MKKLFIILLLSSQYRPMSDNGRVFTTSQHLRRNRSCPE